MTSQPVGPLPQDLLTAAEKAHAAAERAQDELIRVRRAYLSAENAFIERVAAAQEAGEITWREVLTAYDQVRDWATTCNYSGFSERWREHIPLDRQMIRRYADALPRGEDGSWSGHTGWEEMTDSSTYPPRGVHVAFVLFGDAGHPVTYGYTKHFRERTKRMWNGEGLRWRSWTALLARDPEDARAKRVELQARHGQPNVATAGLSAALPITQATPAAHGDSDS
ncbi:MAG TPA: hypothetical protein VHZ96_01530, partial [Frankiaceae bacterium]|nr:hypothetical protein [Frankiaceae bacterium]